jgi:sugar/nucleoside kinase (ribokinase family)
LEDVIDPTGAGDSFAGGMFGYLAKTNDVSWENLKRACVAGSVLASFSVEKLGTKRLQEIKASDAARRFAEFKKLTHFE